MAKTKRKLRFFNGRTIYERGHGYIAAYTKKQAVELGQEAFPGFTMSELNNYWSEAWGTTMSNIQPHVTEPGVWINWHGRPQVWQLVRKQEE
jgi:hypothetical protein